MNKGYTVRVDENDIIQFNRLYSGLLSKYIQKAIKLAIKDKSNFDNIFFASITSDLNIKE